VEDLVISEFLAVNNNGYQDEDDDCSDWIEIHNTSDATVDLADLCLTDDADELSKWRLPSFMLDAGLYLVVFASGKDRAESGSPLHANFKLSGDGEYLALVGVDGATVIHEYAPEFPEQSGDVSYGIGTNESGQLQYFFPPTPGDANTTTSLGEVKDTKFSVDRGFYTEPFEVAITTKTAGAGIRYTLDGSAPSEVHGTVYSGPITISKTTVLRAMAHKTSWRSTDVDTQTYVFPADVLQQPPDPAGFPSSWRGTAADYGMDPDIVNHPEYGPQLVDSLMSIPTVSFATEVDSMFDSSTGIYPNSGGRGERWERPVSVEWFTTDGSEEFQVDCGVRIYGGAFRGMNLTRKKSFRLLFKGIYGPTKLNFPLFPWEENDAGRYDNLVLRAGANDGWNNWGKQKTQYIIDEYMRRMQLAFGQQVGRGRFVHLYINGLYWGIYNIIERPEASFCAEYYGGDKEDWDALNAGGATGDSNRDSWNAMLGQVRNGLSDNESYQRIQGNNPDRTPNPAYDDLIDVDNYIDYMLCNFWGGTGDWPGHNYYCACRRPPDATGFKWFCWDAEGAICVWSSLNANRTGVSNGAGEPYAALRQNSEFQLRFGDHAQRHLFNGGAATPARARRLYETLASEVELATIAESARWGDQWRTDQPYTVDDWRTMRDYVLDTYMPQRTGVVLQQLRNADLYPSIDAPVFSPHGGVVGRGETLTITAADTVYYTLDNTDPREYGTGAILGTEYTAPIVLTHNVVVKSRARSSQGEWSALNEAVFLLAEPSPLRVTEVMYSPRNPTGTETNGGNSADDFEFIELQNTGGETVGLAGTKLTDGVSFDFTSGDVLTLDAGEYVVVVRSLSAFTNRYGNPVGMRIAGEYEGALDNGGEEVSLADGLGSNVLAFTYNDSRGWPLAANGAGHSLVARTLWGQDEGALDYGRNWRASAAIDGSPGGAEPTAVDRVVINEVMAHTDYANAARPEYDSNDWLELLNAGTTTVSFAGWYLSDRAGDLKQWAIPGAHELAPGERLVLDEVNDFHNPITSGFGLNKAGEQVFLSCLPGNSADRVVDCVRFKGQESDRSLGRYPDGGEWWYALAPTADAVNGPPAADVVIGEIMYHPRPTLDNPENNSNDEYIEIVNGGGTAVELWNESGTWRIDGNVAYSFPSNTALAAGASLVLVSFDAADADELREFRNAYGLTEGEVQLLGPYSGQLSNRGGRLALERPQAPDVDGDDVSWVIVDEAIYFDRAPWPAGTDGTGRPLERTVNDRSGNNPANWRAGFWSSPGFDTPVFRIEKPDYGETVVLGSTVEVSLDIDTNSVNGSVHQVEFIADGESICVTTAPPYRCSMGPMTVTGRHAVVAALTDDGGVYTSRQVVVNVAVVDNGVGATAIGTTVATLTGSISDEGSADVTIFWGDTPGGTDMTSWSNSVVLGRQTGGFSAPIIGLLASGTYFYRCHAGNDYGHAWAASATSFTTRPPAVSLALSDSPFAENGGVATVRAELGSVSASNVTVHLAFSGVATFDEDYRPSATSITIHAGEAFGTIELQGQNDSEVEPVETVIARIHSLRNASTGSPDRATAEIVSDDPEVVNSGVTGVTDSTAVPGGELIRGASASIFVFWGTVDGGTNRSAWAATNALGVRSEGPFSTTLTGLMANRTYYYRCYASGADGGDWAPESTPFTTDPPSVSVADLAVPEGDSGSHDAVLNVTLSAASAVPVSVDFATADGSALSPLDYQAGSGRIDFEVGQAVAEIAVPVYGDADNEWPSRDFYVNLAAPTNCTIADGQAVVTILDDDVDVYLLDWTHRVRITFSGYGKDETLTNFPTWVVLNTDCENFDYSQFKSGVGNDLRFANSNLTALLYHEIEQWNTNGDSLVWVRVPELTGTNTSIWAYWGNEAATNVPAYATNGAAWSEGYAGVWHLNDVVTDEETTGVHRDSTENENTGEQRGNVLGEGRTGDGQVLDGNNDYIVLDAVADDMTDNDTAIGGWLKTTDGNGGFISINDSGGGNRLRLYIGKRGAGEPLACDGGSYEADTNTRVDDGAWHHLMYVRRGSTGIWYIDGVQRSSHTANFVLQPNDRWSIGQEWDGGSPSDFMGAVYDEIRVSDVARSSNWVWACWMSTASNALFNTFGEVESTDEDAPSVFVVYGATNVTDSSAYLTARLTSTGAAATAVSAYWGPVDGQRTPRKWANTNDFGPVSAAPPVDYSLMVTGLLPNTQYYYAYAATNSESASWDSAGFVTLGPPLADNAGGAVALGPRGARLHGSLVNGNEADVTIHWGRSDGGEEKSAWEESIPVGTIRENGTSFTAELDGLLYGVQYYYRCCATNGYGEGWSPSTMPFVTQPAVAEPIVNSGATDVMRSRAVLNANLSASGSIYNVSVFWGTEDRGTDAGAWDRSELVGAYSNIASAHISSPVAGLEPGTVYFYTFRATNAAGEAWAASARRFSTSDKVSVPLVASGAAWRYHDDGTDPGTNWMQAVVDDSSWPAGPAPLGYGEGDEATTNAAGFTAYYYRHAVLLGTGDVASLSAARVKLDRDDGAIVYVNGTEIGRDNMPTGVVDYLAPATNAVAGGQEGELVTFDFSPSLLVVGTNVIAVEVHQVSSNDVDGRFDLLLEGVAKYPSVGFRPVPDVSDFTLSAAYPDLSGGLQNDHSGCALVPGTGEVLAILNRGAPTPVIQVYDYAGTFKRQIGLPDWNDTESICRFDAANGKYAIVEEDLADITVVTIASNTTSISKSSGQTYSTGLNTRGGGMEGVAYDPTRACFYLVKEKGPMGVYVVSGTPGDVSAEELFDAEEVFDGLATDLSDLFYDARTDHLLILSHEAKRVFECDLEGNVLASLPLVQEQPEGVALSDDGKELHIIGEANTYYRYVRPWLDGAGGEGATVHMDVGLSSPWFDYASVDYTISSDLAVAGSDYTNAAGSVTGRVVFAPGSTSQVISIEILDDWEAETDEVLSVTLSEPVGSSLGFASVYHHTILGQDGVSLAVSTDHGSPVPPVGTNVVGVGARVACTLGGSPIVLGHTQYVCVGWTGAGDVPVSGSSTNTGTLVVSNASEITWVWGTNYWLGVATVGRGTVSNGNAWCASGTNVTVSATGEQYFAFSHWVGDTGSGDTNQAELALSMDRGRLLTAVFTEELAANGTPKWWLAAHYGHTNDFDALALSDTDNDGMAAWEEHKAGTSPVDDEEYFGISMVSTPGNAEPFVIRWNTVSGRLYSVHSTTNLLLPWITNLPWQPAHGTFDSYTNAGMQQQEYFRIRVKPQP